MDGISTKQPNGMHFTMTASYSTVTRPASSDSRSLYFFISVSALSASAARSSASLACLAHLESLAGGTLALAPEMKDAN
jgi:hypothetical protein